MIIFLIIHQALSTTFGLYDQQNKQTYCLDQDWYFQLNAETSPINNYCVTDSCGTLGSFLGQLRMESMLYKTYSNLDTHTKIQIKMTYIKIDDYVFDSLLITAGTTLASSQVYKILLQEGGAITSQNPQLVIDNFSAPSIACHSTQGSGSSKSFDVVLLIEHTDNNFYIQLSTDYIATTRAWAIRNYEFYLEIDCIINCNKCTSQTYCTECAANRLQTPNCLCPIGYYDSGVPICQKCLASCSTCTNGINCSSCPAGRSGSLCSCNSGTYDQNGSCASCSYQCSTCNNSDTECTSCALNRINIPTCQCVKGYYQSNIQCLQCSYKCDTCENQNSCLTCSNAKRTLPDCLCPSYEVQGQSACSSCSLFCDQCNTVGCTVCKEGYYLNNNQCQKCSYKCATCNSGGCITCSDDSRKIQNQCSCQSYEIQNQAVCPICSPLCQSCDLNGCLSCIGSNRQAPSCGCLPNYYLNSSECQPCPQGCSSCDANGCQSCYDNIHVLPKCECPGGSTDVRGKCILTSNVFTNIFAQFSDDLFSVIIYFSGITNISTILGTTDQIPSAANCYIVNAIAGKCYIQDLTLRIILPDFHQYNAKTIINIVDGGIIINGKKNLVFPNLVIQAKQIYPQFTIQYQQIILSCKTYQFSINNLINVGNTFYQLNIKSNPAIQGLDQNFILDKLNQSNYTITVTLTNFLGFTNNTDILVQVINQLVPQIKIEPLLNDIYAYQEIHINAEVGIESCSSIISVNNGSNIQTKWIVDGVSQSNFGSSSYLTKVFQEYQFKPNTQHKVSLVAQLGEIIQQSDIIINIKPSPILIQTIGGSRVVSTYDDINLEASISDLDKVGYNITWTCVETITQNICPIQFNNSNLQFIPRGALNSYTSYSITIRANNYASQIQLLLKDIGTNQLLVQYPSRYTSQPVNINENLIFISQLEQNGVKQNLLPSQSIKYNIIQNGSIVFSQTQTSSVISFSLQSFPIQPTVVQFIFQDQISYLTLVPNQGPNSGYFQIDQLGYSMNTLINMQLLDFRDANTPLQYKFSFINNDQVIILNEWSYSNRFVTKLPQGRFKNNYNITVIGEVSDSLGAITKLYKNVTIRPQNSRFLLSGQQLIQQIQQSIDNKEDLTLYSYQYSNMQADSCLKNCSKNGVCSDNQCQCKTGYYLDDCSVVEQDYDDIIKAMNKIISQLQQQQMKDMSQTKSQQLADSLRMSLSRLEIQQSLNSSQLNTASQQAQNQLLNLLSDQSIQKANTKNLITDPPDPAKQRRIQQINDNTQSQTLIMDQLFTSTGKFNSTQFNDSSQQNNLNKQMMKQTRNVSSFFANQLFVDQDPQIINGTNFQINSQRLSNQQSIKYLPSSSFIFYNLDEDEMEILYQQGLGDEVEVSTILLNTNPHVADSSFPYQNQSNQFILPNIVNKEGIPQQPKQKLAYTLKVKSNQNNVCITQKDNKWTTNGCAQLNTLLLGESTCSCNSITEVTIIDDIANMFENSNLSALWNPGALINFKFWESGLFYTSTGLFVAWCICIAIGHKKDKVDYQHFLSHKKDEKQVQVQVEVDYDTDEEERKKKEILKKNRRIAKEFVYGFPMLHNFVSIFTVFSDEQPRPARFTIYFLKMTVMMTLTSIFGARLTITQNVVFAVLCVGLMTPITMFLINGFAHDAKKQKKIICVIIIIMIYAGCYYVCLTVAAKMGVDQSNQWLLTYLLTLLLDILIMETITIFLKLLIVPYIKAHIHSGKYLFIFISSFIIRILYLYMFDEQIDIVLSKVS